MKTTAKHRGMWAPSAALTLALASCGLNAHAGRPLATEDAGVNPQAQCQIEAWVDSADQERTAHFAPACGLVAGLELGLEWVHASPAVDIRRATAAALKWAPEWLGLGDWQFGAKLATTHERAPDEAHAHQANVHAMAIASYAISDAWTLHLNIGRERDKQAHALRTNYGTALVWTPHERWLVFGELTGHRNAAATQTVGLRWWLLQEQLGLDLTGSRTNATAASRTWGIGLGWYGIKF
jgi:hypothetical protein